MADKPQLETFVHQNVADRGVHVGVKLNLDQMANSYFPEMFLREAAKAVADRYVAEHYQEIVALIDQKAIATLSVPDSRRQSGSRWRRTSRTASKPSSAKTLSARSISADYSADSRGFYEQRAR